MPCPTSRSPSPPKASSSSATSRCRTASRPARSGRPSSCCTASARPATPATSSGPARILEKLGYVTMRFDMPGCGDSEGPRGRLICLDQVQATSDALTTLAQHPNVDGARIARARLELRRRGRGLLRRRRQARGRGGLGVRLGPRRAQIPQAASDAGGLREVHRHAGGRQGASRAHRRAADGAALRHRADPGAPAHPRAAGLDPDVRGRHRAEHVRLPRQRRGRQDRAAAAAAAAFAPTITSRRSSSRSSCSSTPSSRPSCTCSPTPTTSCSRKATPACTTWCRTGWRTIFR